MTLERKWCGSCKKTYDISEHFTDVDGVYKCNFVLERAANKVETKKCYKCSKTYPLSHFRKHISKKGIERLYCGLLFDENNVKIPIISSKKGCKYPQFKKSECETYSEDWKKDMWLRNKYKINLRQYNKLLNLQDNKCKICNILFETISTKKVQVDHCHITNNIRGILCDKCNKGLGLIKDNIQNIEKAIKYLERHE